MRRSLATIALAACLFPACLLAACGEPPPDLEAAVRASPGAAFVIYDVSADRDVVSVRGDSLLPIVGLTVLVTARALESLDPNSRDTRVPDSRLRARRLPGLEPERSAADSWTLDALLDAALRGDRAAGDEALAQVGRAAVEVAAPPDVGAPLPVGGLLLAWAPERRGDDTPPSARAARFRALPPAARRDSAFARERTFLNSTAYRAAETIRLERRGLGLDAEQQDALAAATLPRGSAAALARLAARPDLLARLRALPATDALPARTAAATMGGLGAALSVSLDGSRIGVVLWQMNLDTEPIASLATRVETSLTTTE